MIRTRVLEIYQRGSSERMVVACVVGDSRRVGSGKRDSLIEVFQELPRKCVLRIRSVQRDAIYAQKVFGLLYVSLCFGTVSDLHGELNCGNWQVKKIRPARGVL